MADATNEVRLWRTEDEPGHVEWSDKRPVHDEGFEGDPGVPYIARPVADDDAREERLRDRDEWKARAERAEAWRNLAEPQLTLRDNEIESLRAAKEKAEAERDSARALLRDLRLCFDANTPAGSGILARIDAELGGGK